MREVMLARVIEAALEPVPAFCPLLITLSIRELDFTISALTPSEPRCAGVQIFIVLRDCQAIKERR